MVYGKIMKLAGVDANLLAALDALLREKSVTRAARCLGVGQPAVSHSLSCLRAHFNDELLVLKGRDYVLTTRAESLARVVGNATRALSQVFNLPPSFDAATASHRFVVACPDLIATLVVPDLLRVLKQEAKNVEVDLRALTTAPKEAKLADGVDLALGVFEDVPPGLNQQPLYDDRVVCVVRADHEQVGAALSLETYGRLPHLQIGPTADAIPEQHIDRALAALGKQRRVSLRVPYYLLAPQIWSVPITWPPFHPVQPRCSPEWRSCASLNPPFASLRIAILRSGKTIRTIARRTSGCASASLRFVCARRVVVTSPTTRCR